MLAQAPKRQWGARAGLVAAVFAVAALAGCGGIARSTTVVRVGGHTISKATVDHWVSVIKHEAAFAGARGEPSGPPERRALALLISSDWLIGEAAQQGVAAPEHVVDEALAAREQGSEFQEQRRESGLAIADIKLEIRAELAAEALRKKLARRAEYVAAAEVMSFYRGNRELFSTGVRVTDLLEGRPSAAAAAAAAPLLKTPPRYGGEAIHEHVTQEPGFTRTPEKTHVVDAIFAARTGVVSHPVLLNKSWAIFIVRKAIVGRPLPFAKARAQVLVRLSERHQRLVASRFDSYYTAKWEAQTSCRAGYIGPGCRQWARALGAYEDPFSLRTHLLVSEPLGQP